MRGKKRQKLCSCVKERSRKGGIAAETLQWRKETVGYARKSGRKFTRVRTDGTNRKCEQSTEPEETAESLQRCKVSVGCARKNGRKFTPLSRNGRMRAKKRQKLCSGVKEKSDTSEKTAESLQLRKETVGCVTKNDRNFTRVRKEGADRKCGTAGSGRKFTRVYRKSRLHAKKRQKLYKSGQTERTESANRVRNRKKRQKLYSGVKKKSDTSEKAAKTVQPCKEKVGCAPKNGRKFTRARKEGTELAGSGRNFTRE